MFHSLSVLLISPSKRKSPLALRELECLSNIHLFLFLMEIEQVSESKPCVGNSISFECTMFSGFLVFIRVFVF